LKRSTSQDLDLTQGDANVRTLPLGLIDFPNGDEMNHHHRKVLQAVFAHPISANIDMKELERALEALGAEIEHKSGARLGVTLAGHKVAIQHVNHSVPKEEIVQVRKFLETCGVTATDYPI
jgi:hypothetical protein